ncbi:dihydroneopterin aldolase [Rhizobium halophilum]|uniref:dihydroneopterin aldolase n=1 Tax=Rhizobium halophilum TaxID=2846852 RepID=UPI001EFEBF8D|nr:dihydroneopterin aldolase [Rhizobium halophilum]MCF6368442.1 dihydroneopterin aldolase [Rhizobium halophilum]HEV7437808.1 dihydroneopterin aldolase [Pseudorhizobium sp.]
MTFYTITLKNCAFFARHGVLEQENVLGQRFFVDATLDVQGGDALHSDQIEDTVHYGEAFLLIEEVVTGQQRKLIETLAMDVAKALCGRFQQIRRAEIAIRKPSAPIPGILDYAEVRIDYRPS